MGAEYINIGGVQFRPASFIDMDKKSFVTYYSAKIKGRDINEVCDIIQDHIKPIVRDQEIAKQNAFNKKTSSKVVKK